MGTGKFWVDRSLFTSDLFTEEKANDTSAWIDLIGMTSYKPKYIKIRDVRVLIQRGEIGHSIEFYAKRWDWSTGKVRRFFKHLEGRGMIKRHPHRSTITTIISIPNYDKYQSNSTAERRTDGQSNDSSSDYSDGNECNTANRTQLNKENKDNKHFNLKKSYNNDKDSSSQIDKTLNFKILEKWNALLPNGSDKTLALSEDRHQTLSSRIAGCKGLHESIEETIDLLFKKIQESDYLSGRTNSGRHTDWDWVMMSDDNWLKILEGKYANKTSKQIKYKTPLMDKESIKIGL